jgi:hypothetical protein
MKIKFFSNYDTPEGLLKRFLSNYSVWDDELSFTLSEDYEFAVVFNQTADFIMPSAKVITVIQEPSWSPAHHNKKFLQGSDYLIIHDPQLFEQKLGLKLGGKVIQSPSYMFYDDRVDKTFFHYASSTKKIRKLSMIVSYLNVPFGIYQKRTALLQKILDSDLDIDIYGRRLPIRDPRYKGYIEYKFSGLLPYEYSIAIENSEEKNYLTEKFVDCILCNTIPIYYGAPNAAEIYDSRYFKSIDLDSPAVIDDIREIIAAPAPYSTVNKAIYFNQFNLYKKLKEIVLDKNYDCN